MALYVVNPLRAVAAPLRHSVDLWLGYFGNHKRDAQTGADRNLQLILAIFSEICCLQAKERSRILRFMARPPDDGGF